MKRYDEYKDSGIEWIGEIPSHWEVIPLKFVSSCNDESLPETTPLNTDIEYVEISDVQESNGIVNITNYSFEEAPSRARRITRVGDVIVSTVRTYLKAVAKVENGNLIVSTGFAVLRAKNINSSFLAYLALSDNFIQAVIALSKGVSYPAITATDLIQIKVAIPTATEQHCITQYLDRKCASIDKVIATQERRIALLDELKQSIITEAVTRGINPEDALRDSGIDWIGKIPEHWEICRFKNFVSLVTTPSISDNKIGLENIESNTGRYIDSDSEFEGNGVAFQIGDILYGKLRPYLKKVWLAEFSGNAVGDFFNFRCKLNANSEFVKYLMLSEVFTSLADSATNGAKMPRVSSEFILSLKVAIPLIEEQRLIVRYINSKIEPIDRAISKANREVELLRELKQSIITEAVTGKIKVC